MSFDEKLLYSSEVSSAQEMRIEIVLNSVNNGMYA